MSEGSEGSAIWLTQPRQQVGLASGAMVVPVRSSQARPAQSYVPRAGAEGMFGGGSGVAVCVLHLAAVGDSRGGGWDMLCSEVWADGMWPDGGTRGRRSEEPCNWEGL